MTYAEKLKDPRWQKKRLEILDRDEWCCQSCFADDQTLNVHHKVYNKGEEPWEIDSDYLITLCVDCHNEESEEIKHAIGLLSEEVRKKFLSGNITEIALGFHAMKHYNFPDSIASAIGWAISDADMCWLIEKKYVEYIKKTVARRGENDAVFNEIIKEGIY